MSALGVDFDGVVAFGEERVLGDVEDWNSGGKRFRVGRSIGVVATKMLHIWWKFSEGEIIHAFIKSTVIAALDNTGSVINPDDVLVSARTEAEEATFASVGEELLARFGISGLDPDTTTKGAKTGEVILGASGSFMSRGGSTATG
jgi:hypothetical protein